ncbi:MAG TPA: glutamine--fructose-6-phosphate transaminase (isomerizing) [Actinomycetota bacterium]|nr:glutamine--fructose-6-phosphate transaminase (isomerizing) [Actinomycetota bacterium]
MPDVCGIVGYSGPQKVLPILLQGLHSLEYRGYDSAGIALVGADALRVMRRAGKVGELEEATGLETFDETTGIGHTRWATCGAPTETNAHPHVDCSGRLAVVHNGIIENHVKLRTRLQKQGHEFRSETDTETIVHLLESHFEKAGSLVEALRLAAQELEGSFAIVAVSADEPLSVAAARRDAPLVLGLGSGENFVASDVVALIAHTRQVVPLLDDQVALITPTEVSIFDSSGAQQPVEADEVSWDVEAAEKGGYSDFMLKEIHEQPSAVRETLRGRFGPDGELMLDELRISDEEIKLVDKVFVVACGSSFHAGLVAKYAIEHWTRLPVEIDVASEFRYRDPVLDERTLVVGISQSGETADTLAAIRYAGSQKAKMVAITNVVGSSITREADAVLYTHAGPEVGVAATKTLTTQMTALWLLALWMAQIRGTKYVEETSQLMNHLHEIPNLMESVLADDALIQKVADRYRDAPTFLFIGRGVGFPVAMEGALKLKEVSYLHAEGFAAGEMKHGPIALIEQGVPVVAIATPSHIQAKVVSNIEEARARGAEIIAVAEAGDDQISALAEAVLEVPRTQELLSPVIDVLPLQLLAYYVAKAKGLDPDKPRNLAKSVTVE